MGKGRFFEFRPVDLAIEDVDMTAALNTNYSSGMLDLRGVKSISVGSAVTQTDDAAAGLAGIYIQRYDLDGVALGAEHALATAINTKADTVTTVSLSEYLAAEALNGTIGANDRNLLPLGRCKLVLRVTEQNDGTTATMSVWLVASQ